ncbi:hypothetical protein M1N85_04820, partial [Dehalococcoidia bacterium]|nr:hypothetical protein [Dehalococcoidia bacterium]
MATIFGTSFHILAAYQLGCSERNVANHRRQKAERGTSGAFCGPYAFALLCFLPFNPVIWFSMLVRNGNDKDDR